MCVQEIVVLCEYKCIYLLNDWVSDELERISNDVGFTQFIYYSVIFLTEPRKKWVTCQISWGRHQDSDPEPSKYRLEHYSHTNPT